VSEPDASTPLIAQAGPYAVAVEAGKTYWWCACGRSANQPFCDGSHKACAIKPLKYLAGDSTTLWFCGCKRTGSAPLCDGSHDRLAADDQAAS